MKTLDQLITDILTEQDYLSNPYFTSLQDGSMSKDDFVETQIQFYFAVLFFPRPMAAATARIPTHSARCQIVRNVWEEHGSGEENAFHERTFLEFLNRLANIDMTAISLRKLWPEVRIFNTTLIGACVLDEYIIGIGMLGMIERMFSDISSLIGKATIARRFLTPEQLIHYDLHEELDIAHADDFFNVLKKPYSISDENRYLIEQGLRLGAHCFDQLYHGFYSARSRRLLSETPILRHQRS